MTFNAMYPAKPGKVLAWMRKRAYRKATVTVKALRELHAPGTNLGNMIVCTNSIGRLHVGNRYV